MKFIHVVLASAIAVSLVACNESKQAEQSQLDALGVQSVETEAAGELALDTQLRKFSYVVGVDMGGQFKTSDINIDLEAFAAGVADALDDRRPRIAPEELEGIVQSFHAEQQEKIKDFEEAQKAVSEKNTLEGKLFLAENEKKEGVTKTETGLQYKVIVAGTGASPKADSLVEVHYRGTLVNGLEFDASTKHGGAVKLNVSEVIPGWTEALPKMKEGAKWELYLPPELAYGPQGTGETIGPNATLIFEVELLKVLNQQQP